MPLGSLDLVEALALGAGLGFAGAGLWALYRSRPGHESPRWSLAGIGRLSSTSFAVAGLACLVIGYHVVVHALGVALDFRAPLWLGLGGPAVAVAFSFMTDAVDNARGGEGLDP